MQLGGSSMKKLLSFASAIIVLAAAYTFMPQDSDAYKGRLDKLGGHFRNADCHYILEKPTALAKTAKSKAELIELIQQKSSNSCKKTLTTAELELGTYKLPDGQAQTPEKPKTSPAKKAPVSANTGKMQLHQTYHASLSKCVDGDTAWFDVGGKTYKTRFLFIDTPESTNKIEPYGKEASAYTCTLLKKAKKIELETDGNSVFDKYNRLLAWVWVDGKLQQISITEAGLVKKYYDYGDYKYEDQVREAMASAKKEHQGMYK